MTQQWRSITTWGAPPSFNMGLDEALLLNQEAQPTLRFYSWSPDTLSLGYFQKYDDIPATQKASAVVRRLTGGGAIHHVNELTFSFTAPANNELYRGNVGESYTRIHAAIAKALRHFGVDAQARGKDVLLDSERPDTGMCFHKSSCEDLIWSNRKGVGSAQRRTKGRVLHHGSIKLGSSPLEGNIATIDEFAGALDPAVLRAQLLKSFESELGLEFEVGVPTPDERQEAHKLGTRYLTKEWLKRR
jgi:lipoate-protein ligase A